MDMENKKIIIEEINKNINELKNYQKTIIEMRQNFVRNDIITKQLNNTIENLLAFIMFHIENNTYNLNNLLGCEQY